MSQVGAFVIVDQDIFVICTSVAAGGLAA